MVILLISLLAAISVVLWAVIITVGRRSRRVLRVRLQPSAPGGGLDEHIAEIYNRGQVDGIPVGHQMFRGVILYWRDICLDTTAFGWQARGALNPHRLPSELEKRDLLDLVHQYWDRPSGGFKHHPNANATIYGTRAAFIILRLVEGLSIRDIWTDPLTTRPIRRLLGDDGLERLRTFVWDCWIPGEGFSELPQGQVGTITTDAGITLLRNMVEELSLPDRRSVAHYLWRESRREYEVEGGPAYGLSYGPNVDTTDGRSTQHGVEAIRRLDESLLFTRLADDPELPERAGSRDYHDMTVSDSVWRFLKACQRFPKGPCLPFPDAKTPASLLDTNAIYATMRSFTHDDSGLREQVSLEAMLELLQDWMGEDGGFGFGPRSPNNIYAVRGAAFLYSALSEVFRHLANNPRTALLERIAASFDALRTPGHPFFHGFKPQREATHDCVGTRENECDLVEV